MKKKLLIQALVSIGVIQNHKRIDTHHYSRKVELSTDKTPATVAQQVSTAQAEVATWPEGKLRRVKLAGGDQP